jgi:hypothetical protein
LQNSHQNLPQLTFPNPILLDSSASQGHTNQKFWVEGACSSRRQAEADFGGGLARPGNSWIQEGCLSQDEPGCRVSFNNNGNYWDLKRAWKGKENEPNGSLPNQIVSKWHPDKDGVEEIKQEWNLKFVV